tara:strand:- start:526 stop:843 length:318 start_codon:yes stop_codon:yes gene_type:complete
MGFLLGCGLFYLMALLSNGGMGGGDIKYIAAAGAFLGWQKVLLIIFIGAVLGTFVGLFQIVVQKKNKKKDHSFWPTPSSSHFDHIVSWKSFDKIIYRKSVREVSS